MNEERQEQAWWRTPIGLVACGFLIVAGFFLLTEHTAHVFGVLPWLLILACPLMQPGPALSIGGAIRQVLPSISRNRP